VFLSILNHLEANSILTHLQHGFRVGRLCEAQLLTTLQDFIQNYDLNNQIDIAVLDFAKAFDTGHTKECAQCDQCAQPLSAACDVRARPDERHTAHSHACSTSHAGKQSTVRSASTAACVYSAGGRLRTVAQNENGCSNGLRALIALRALRALFGTTVRYCPSWSPTQQTSTLCQQQQHSHMDTFISERTNSGRCCGWCPG